MHASRRSSAETADIPRGDALGFAAACVPPQSAYEVLRVEDEDWVRRTQSQFTPQQITPELWIVPSWHALPEPSAINIVLDPGLAFGTGTHPTTRLCLRWLARELRHGPSAIAARTDDAHAVAPSDALRHGASTSSISDAAPASLRSPR